MYQMGPAAARWSSLLSALLVLLAAGHALSDATCGASPAAGAGDQAVPDQAAAAVTATATSTTTSTTTSTATVSHSNHTTAFPLPRFLPLTEEEQDGLVAELVGWIQSRGGHVSDKVVVRTSRAGGPRGIYATADLAEGEAVCSIPWDLVLRPPGGEEGEAVPEDYGTYDPDDGEFCGTVEAVYQDMRGGGTPHGRYLAAQPRRYIPPLWSREGQWFLGDLVGHFLPPREFSESFAEFECSLAEGRGELYLHAQLMVAARADDAYLTPFYDMINHRNGPHLNTVHNVEGGVRFELLTSRPVRGGEQLYNSYNRCRGCGGRKYAYGTPELLQAYGFVEEYPQRYVIEEVRLKFDVEEVEEPAAGTGSDGAGEEDAGRQGSPPLAIRFAVPPSAVGMAYLRRELRRLEEFGRTHRADPGRTAGVPAGERDTVWNYHGALVRAFGTAVREAEEADLVSERVWECSAEDWVWVEDYTVLFCDDEGFFELWEEEEEYLFRQSEEEGVEGGNEEIEQ